MQKLAVQNLSERTPSRFVEWFFESHPAIEKRIMAAEAWEKGRQERGLELQMKSKSRSLGG